MNMHDYTHPRIETSTGILEAAQGRIEQLEKLMMKQTFYMQLQAMPDKMVRFHTGFPSFKVLEAEQQSICTHNNNK